MEDDLNFPEMEDDLNFFKNGRQTQFFQKLMMNAIFPKIEMRLSSIFHLVGLKLKGVEVVFHFQEICGHLPSEKNEAVFHFHLPYFF